ncbi:two-component regulator propeller domain-containing protein [Bizionia sediminis]|uniref:Two-component regulator propeller domain-containing protein n=1 Tax=Bizionia sediminis TaxID=1737064 RepID=A0ABW5KRB1_9FLAO
MLQRLVITLFFLMPFVHSAQNFSALWQGHYSYLNITDIAEGNGKLYAAAENAIFVYDLQTAEIQTISTVNGLSGEIISQIYYSAFYDKLLVGYNSGLLEIVSDLGNEVLTVVDILNKTTIPPTNKRINHFNEYNGLLYIATDYGISVYDLARLEFGDTYFIGNGGAQVIVSETTIYNDYIYAACQNANGLKRALVANTNLIDFNQWSLVGAGDFSAVTAFNNQLFVLRNDQFLLNEINGNLNPIRQFNSLPVDMRVVNNYLIITQANVSYVYNENFSIVATVPVSSEFNSNYSAALVSGPHVYLGTNKFGILKTTLEEPVMFQEIHPDGPLLNNSFAVGASANNLWLTYGEYNLTYNPGPLQSRGISHFVNGENWVNIPADSVLGARDLNKIAVNPFNPQQVFISSFNDGLLEVNRNVPTVLYNESNSGLESLILPGAPNFKSIRQNASTFDKDGILWTMTARVGKPLKSYNPSTGQWQGYDFLDLIQRGLDEWGYDEIDIDNNGTKWIAGYKFGLIAYNEANTGRKIANISTDEQNVPSPFITALAVDKNDQVWFGTTNGLRVLYNTANFFTDRNVRAESVIILDDGTPSELLFQQFVSDIEVDGSNNKWISTIGTGLYYFSANGQETIYHFTEDNSPLPSNIVIDVAIDPASGRIYIATDRGLVSFGSGSSETKESLENAYVYPNPVRPGFNILEEKVKIKDISENVNIKITDIEGNLVAEAQSGINSRFKGYNLEIDGGVAYWNGNNLANNLVQTGVYLVMLSDLDTFETKVIKVMVVR